MLTVLSIAYAGEAWSVDAIHEGRPVGGALRGDAVARVGWSAGLVPEFRTAARDRLAVEVEGTTWLGRVQLGVGGDWIRDENGAGEVVTGFGDLRLGAAVRVADPGPIEVALGWDAKLPNAADEGEIGTDETDVRFGLTVTAARGDFRGAAAFGLAVLGNPLRFANQDDVPMARASLAWVRPWFSVAPSFSWDFATARNPARGRLGAEVRAGRTVFGVLGGAAGLTPAAADWSVSAGVGVRWDLPGRTTGA